jgi:hypothetical protein
MSADPSPSDLPAGLFAAAMASHLRLHEQRIRTMFNRHRALFAEALVAEALPGAEVVLDPTAAWDITWFDQDTQQRIRIQVKCSGGYLPRRPQQPAPVNWQGLRAARSGYDPDRAEVVRGEGHLCEVFILARHEGNQIEQGWTFAAIPRQLVEGRSGITAATLRRWDLTLVGAGELASLVRRAAAP